MTMSIYKAQSGRTALKITDEITALFGSCFRLDTGIWHHVGDTEPFDPSMSPEVLEKMCQDTVENLDKRDFDLSKSMAEIREEDFT